MTLFILHILFFISFVFACSDHNNTLALYQTALVLATDASAGAEATSILSGYGQPTELLSIPQEGIALPTLETIDAWNNSVGNFGLIVIIGLVPYDYGGSIGWASAITSDQWTQLYDYQLKYGVRMVHLDAWAGSFPGVTLAPGPGGTYDTQPVTLIDPSIVPTAGLRNSGNLTTDGLWHSPATITDTTTTTAFLEFGTNVDYATETVGGVIQNFSGREQMVIFFSGATWSLTTNYIGHIWFHWGYRGIYNGFRRVAMHQQIDDMFLTTTDLYVCTGPDPEGPRERINTTDVQMHLDWVPEFEATLNPGSVYLLEFGFNGDGTAEYIGNLTSPEAESCPPALTFPGPIGPQQDAEWLKPVGTGVSMWPSDTTYDWTAACLNLDPLVEFFQDTTKRDSVAWCSHTFTHENLENATYFDAYNQIYYNYRQAQVMGLANAAMWSNQTFIPPAISGMHNGDALHAFMDNGIIGGVGDSTRPVLLNPNNTNWPLITTVAGNGYAGYTIIPRWATRIYYNVGNQYEAAEEWRLLDPYEADGTAGDIYALLNIERTSQVANILSLSRAPFMFHQINLRVADVLPTTINGVTKQRSLYQMWAETIGPEITSLVNWPLIALKIDDLVQVYIDRMTKDDCNPTTQLLYANATTITGFTVGADGNSCPVPIPVTIPSGNVTDLLGSRVEQVGNDPMTIWVTLSGSPKTFTLTEPISIL